MRSRTTSTARDFRSRLAEAKNRRAPGASDHHTRRRVWSESSVAEPEMLRSEVEMIQEWILSGRISTRASLVPCIPLRTSISWFWVAGIGCDECSSCRSAHGQLRQWQSSPQQQLCRVRCSLEAPLATVAAQESTGTASTWPTTKVKLSSPKSTQRRVVEVRNMLSLISLYAYNPTSVRSSGQLD